MAEIMKNESLIELTQALNQIGWGIEKLQFHHFLGNAFKLELLLEPIPTKPKQCCGGGGVGEGKCGYGDGD